MAQVSRRTVHYYVQRGLIDPPAGRGRGSGYTQKHVGQIAKVVSLQRNGLSLDEIALVKGEPNLTFVRSPTQLSFWIPVSAGVAIRIDAGSPLPDVSTVTDAYAAFLALKQKGASDEQH